MVPLCYVSDGCHKQNTTGCQPETTAQLYWFNLSSNTLMRTDRAGWRVTRVKSPRAEESHVSWFNNKIVVDFVVFKVVTSSQTGPCGPSWQTLDLTVVSTRVLPAWWANSPTVPAPQLTLSCCIVPLKRIVLLCPCLFLFELLFYVTATPTKANSIWVMTGSQGPVGFDICDHAPSLLPCASNAPPDVLFVIMCF